MRALACAKDEKKAVCLHHRGEFARKVSRTSGRHVDTLGDANHVADMVLGD